MAVVVDFELRHAEGVARLCAAENWPSWTVAKTTRALSAPGVIAVVAEDDGEVVGAAQLLTDGEVMAYLGMLVVAESERGQGIGRDLVQGLFTRSGLHRMDLLSEDASIPFYESIPHKRKPGFRLYADQS